MSNALAITTCIKHLAVSGLSSVSARIKSGCNLIRNRFEMPNVSYTRPLCGSLNDTPVDTKTTDNDKIISHYY